MDSFPEDLGVKVIHDRGRVAGAGMMSHRLDVSVGGEQEMKHSSLSRRLHCVPLWVVCMLVLSPQVTHRLLAGQGARYFPCVPP